MPWLLFSLYFIVLAWLLTKSKFIVTTGISSKWVIILYSIRIMAGMGYSYIHSKIPDYKVNADTWHIHEESLKDYDLLKKDPVGFLKAWFANPDKQDVGDLFSSQGSYWNDLKGNLPVKFEAVLNIFSGGHYYTNLLFFNFLVIFGCFALYKLWTIIFGTGKKIAAGIGAFILPSTLFWTSGIHKDGLILLLTSLLVYHFYFFIKQGIKSTRLLIMISTFAGIFLLRNYMALALLPALFTWWLAAKGQRAAWKYFAGVYITGIVLFFSAKHIHPSLDFPNYVAERQKEFNAFEVNSILPADTLQPTPVSFIINLPTAINHALLRPYLWDNFGKQYLLFAAEAIALLILIMMAIVQTKGRVLTRQQVTYLLFSIAFVGSLWLFWGYVVNIMGALVRYKNVILPFIAGPIACVISWKRGPAEVKG